MSERKDAREQKGPQSQKGLYSAPPVTQIVPNDILEGIGPEFTGKPLQRRTPLSAYTPRELILELKKRNFTGHLEWVPPTPKPRRINLADFE